MGPHQRPGTDHDESAVEKDLELDIDLGAGTGSPPSVASITSRRQVLRAGGLGFFGASFLGAFGAASLAACGTEDTQAGISGAPRTSTTETPTVPTSAPSEVDLAEDAVQLGTAASVERLVAEVYGAHGPKLSTTALRAAAADYQSAHEAAAEYLLANGDVVDGAGRSNAYLQANLVDPVAPTLTNDTAILGFLGQLESTLVAGYLGAVGVLTSADWRQRVMTFGGAGARRVAVLAGSGDGSPEDSAPTEALYPLVDLVPGEAFIGREDPEAAGG